MSRPRWQQNNYISGLGTTKGQMVQVNLTASTGLHTAERIPQSRGEAGGRRDRAAEGRRQRHARLGQTTRPQVAFDGKPAVYIGIQVAPAANLLDVIAGVRKVFPAIHAQLPQGPERPDRLRFDRIS